MKSWHLLVFSSVLSAVINLSIGPRAFAAAPSCQDLFRSRSEPTVVGPRKVDSQKTFDALVDWIYDDLIIKRGAPGLVVGISGTDSIVAFLAAAKAFERAGKPDRVAGVHYAPSEDFLDDIPEARAHLWFQDHVIPWLKKQAPRAQIVVDTSLDFRRDGLRWGALMDWSVTENSHTRAMRPPDQQFWVVGTRNATEEALFNYSNASMAASVQVLTHIWKSEVLQISKHLGVPEIAIDKSCEVDCVCGRMRLPAHHIPEVDALLMNRAGLVSDSYILQTIKPVLRQQLIQFINSQTARSFKLSLPYRPTEAVIHLQADPEISPKKLEVRLQKKGNSFGQWRFLTQRTDSQSSLAELFGMKRLTRATDLRDAALDATDVNRDELGPGFVWSDSEWYIEYRRAYIAISSLNPKKPATLVIRNNSTYFGVDRLPHAVSFTTSPVAITDLQNLTAGDFSSSGFFGAWSHPSSDSPSDPAMALRLSEMLDRLDQFNLELSRWLEGQGRAALLDFLEAKIKSGTPINLGLIDDKDGFILPGPSVILVPTLRLIQARRKNGKPFFENAPERKTHRLVLITG